MDTLYLLLPMSVLLVLGLIGLFAWAINSGQFDDLEREGWRIVDSAENAPPAHPHTTPGPGDALADSSPNR